MFRIETEREDDGRWIGEVTTLPGVLVYSATEAETKSKAAALAFHVIADRIEQGEPVPDEARELFALTRVIGRQRSRPQSSVHHSALAGH
jgi:predicted RNase H-like HicB family nuclease